MAEAGTLHDAFIDELRDAYDAEKQLTKALPKLAKAATSAELRKAFETHLEETRGTNRAPRAGLRDPRREGEGQALRRHRRASSRKASRHGGGLRGGDHGRLPDRRRPAGRALRDGGLRHAGRVGTGDGPRRAANLLQQNLDEEKAADKKLSTLAEGGINQEAADAAIRTKKRTRKRMLPSAFE